MIMHYASLCIIFCEGLLKISFGQRFTLKRLYPAQKARINAQNCGKFINPMECNISCFQEKNSHTNIIVQNNNIPIYHTKPRICINKESIYSDKPIKNEAKAYMIGRGKIGTWNGIGLNECLLYNISIQKFVSLQYTCHQKKDPIYQIVSAQKNAITTQSTYRSKLLFSIYEKI